MAHQLSEMKAKYKGQVDLTPHLTPHPNLLQTATLADHFANGPTKVLFTPYHFSENYTCMYTLGDSVLGSFLPCTMTIAFVCTNLMHCVCVCCVLCDMCVDVAVM